LPILRQIWGRNLFSFAKRARSLRFGAFKAVNFSKPGHFREIEFREPVQELFHHSRDRAAAYRVKSARTQGSTVSLLVAGNSKEFRPEFDKKLSRKPNKKPSETVLGEGASWGENRERRPGISEDQTPGNKFRVV
jgi:hypothetical protein